MNVSIMPDNKLDQKIINNSKKQNIKTTSINLYLQDIFLFLIIKIFK